MGADSNIIALGAIFFGTLICLISYNIIGRNFTSQTYHNWLASRRTYFRVLGPVLTILGIIYLFSEYF